MEKQSKLSLLKYSLISMCYLQIVDILLAFTGSSTLVWNWQQVSPPIINKHFNVLNISNSALSENIKVRPQSQEITQSENFFGVIVYVLQNFFISFWLHRVHIFLAKSAVHYLYHLKSNNVIGQRKNINAEKHFYS